MLFPSRKSDELFDFSLGRPAWKMKCGAAFWAGCSESHVPCGFRRRELTPVRLCSVRLSWRQRARPSTTLHEIQICRSRLEYFVCITAGGGPQLGWAVPRKLYRLGAMGWEYWTGDVSRSLVRERTSMRRYLKFTVSFWMSAFLVTASMAAAQTTSTAKAKKKSGSSTTNTAPAANTQSGTTTATTLGDTTSAAQTTVAHDQQSMATTTTTTAPKMMIGPDKRMIPVPPQQ
jgi:hypothetical protein